MFGFGKKKVQVATPIFGKIMDITEVKDEVFSSKMMGDGFAVEPEADIITAPCDGKIVFIADTLHAIAIESAGVQILIHVGLDTVQLGGKGFQTYVQIGDIVEKGAKLILLDREYILEQEKLLTTMIIITNMAEKVKNMEKNLDNENAILILLVR